MKLQFLADESCDFAVVRCLRTAKYDVQAIMEIASDESDANIIKMAVDTGRILITEDRDFGDLVYAPQKRQRSCRRRRHNWLPKIEVPID